jgi:hypothetical protein
MYSNACLKPVIPKGRVWELSNVCEAVLRSAIVQVVLFMMYFITNTIILRRLCSIGRKTASGDIMVQNDT